MSSLGHLTYIRPDVGEEKCQTESVIQQLYARGLGLNHLGIYITTLCASFILHGKGHETYWDVISRASPEFATEFATELRKSHSR